MFGIGREMQKEQLNKKKERGKSRKKYKKPIDAEQAAEGRRGNVDCRNALYLKTTK